MRRVRRFVARHARVPVALVLANRPDHQEHRPVGSEDSPGLFKHGRDGLRRSRQRTNDGERRKSRAGVRRPNGPHRERVVEYEPFLVRARSKCSLWNILWTMQSAMIELWSIACFKPNDAQSKAGVRAGFAAN